MGIAQMQEKEDVEAEQLYYDRMLYKALVHNDVNPNNMDELTNFRDKGYE